MFWNGRDGGHLLSTLGWVDHYGQIGNSFVAEPYGPITSDWFEMLSAIQQRTRAKVAISAPGSWNPATTRITISEPPLTDESPFSEGRTPVDLELTHTIYGLRDPRDNLFRYIGQTREFERRMEEHLLGRMNDNYQKCLWVREVAEAGLHPGIEVLEKATWLNYRTRERHWIQKLRLDGHPLLNKEYGIRVNANRDDWELMAGTLQAMRDLAHSALSLSPKLAKRADRAVRCLESCRSYIDKARCRYDDLYWQLNRNMADEEQRKCVNFYGGDS